MSEQDERPITLYQVNEMEQVIQFHLNLLMDQLRGYVQGIGQLKGYNTSTASRARYEIKAITSTLEAWKERLRDK